jgi:hypothetical protein
MNPHKPSDVLPFRIPKDATAADEAEIDGAAKSDAQSAIDELNEEFKEILDDGYLESADAMLIGFSNVSEIIDNLINTHERNGFKKVRELFEAWEGRDSDAGMEKFGGRLRPAAGLHRQMVASLISGIVFGQYLARFASNYVTMYAGLASVIIALVFLISACSSTSERPYGHFGDGCLHTRINFELEAPEGAKKYRSFIDEAAGHQRLGEVGEVDEVDGAVLEQANHALRTIADGISAGVFLARPNDEDNPLWDCPACNPDGLGEHGVDLAWKAKTHVPELVPLRSMLDGVVPA